MLFLEGKCTKWEEDPFVLGSYAAYVKGSSPEDCRVLTTPVDNKLWMVGEHCSYDFIGSAHGAWRTGLNAAKEILSLHSITL
jgi:monoamine oxidase